MNAWNMVGPEPTGVAEREVVRAAEQTVGDAWIGRLLLAESETETAAEACVRARKRAADRVRHAQQAGDLAALARSQRDLETADTACGYALKANEQARTRLSHELTAWSESTARRVRQALSDQPGALGR